jgi:hypothetical protein
MHMRQRLASWWRAVPCKLLWALVAACALLQEWYPFSHFPMYSNFEPFTYYVYAADGDDQPVPLATAFGIRSANLKKIYDRELRRLAKGKPRGMKSLTLEERGVAGKYALEFLRANSVDPARTDALTRLKFYQVDIRMEHGHITKHAQLVAEL